MYKFVSKSGSKADVANMPQNNPAKSDFASNPIFTPKMENTILNKIKSMPAGDELMSYSQNIPLTHDIITTINEKMQNAESDNENRVKIYNESMQNLIDSANKLIYRYASLLKKTNMLYAEEIEKLTMISNSKNLPQEVKEKALKLIAIAQK
jgi:hypothetical protein